MPSNVANIDQDDVYLVLNDYGPLGRAYAETDPGRANKNFICTCLMKGEFKNPVRVVCINVAIGYCGDVSEEIAEEIVRRCRLGENAAEEINSFLEAHLRTISVTA
jgi:hypothetical protein